MALVDGTLLDQFVFAGSSRMRSEVVADDSIVVQQGVADREDVHVDGRAVDGPARQVLAARHVALAVMAVTEVLERSDGTHLALFVDQWRAKVTARDNPDVMLESLPAGGS